MGGGPVMRSLAAVGSLGLSELTQKKPFQDLGSDNPTKGTGGIIRFIPGGSQVAGLMGMLTDEMTPDKPNFTATPTLGQDDAAQKAKDAAAEAERLRSGRGRASTFFSGEDSGPQPRLKRYLGGF